MIDILTTLTTAVIGLYAGSLLTEAMILVPFWRGMSADDFFEGHGQMGPSLFRYFAPLTVLAVILSIVTAVVSGGRHIWVAGLCLTALAIFFIYFKKANQSFADHSLSHDALPAELARWQTWHWIRTIIIIAALLLSVSA